MSLPAAEGNSPMDDLSPQVVRAPVHYFDPSDGWPQPRGKGGRLRSGSVKSNCEKLREMAGKLRCRNHTSQRLKEQHFGTGDTRRTNKHARWASKKQLQKNCGKLRTSNPPPPAPTPTPAA